LSTEFVRFPADQETPGAPPRHRAIPPLAVGTGFSSVAVGEPRENPTPLAGELRLVETALPRRSKGSFQQAIRIGEAAADILTITLTIVSGYLAYRHLALGRHVYYPTATLLQVAIGFAVIMVLMLDRTGAYERCNSLLRVRETEQILRVSAQTALIALVVSFLTTVLFSRWLLVLCIVLIPLALFVQKTLVYLLINTLHAHGYGIERVLIYGAGRTGRRVYSALKRSPRLGLDPVLFVDDDPTKTGSEVFEMGYERRRSAAVLAGPVSQEMLENHAISSVIVAASMIRDKFLRTVEAAFGANATVSFVPSHFFSSDSLMNYQDVDGVLLASFGKSARHLGYETTKRVLDIVFATLLSVVGFPLFLLISAIVKLDSRGPVLFRQQRVGKDGKIFLMYKFRTMLIDTPPYSLSPQSSDDPRITRFGRFFRKTSLDEVPQLLNVLKGEMSLVGPRPEMPFVVEQYEDRHRQRLQVKPGLTGLWQLSGDRAFLIHENIEYDLYYIQHCNIFMDLAILLHTSIFAMRGI
jgi:exopolysaccharide biosynthesis polyprenyl glycosylphosphotransferase